MILSTIIAASVATQSAPAPGSNSSPVPAAEKKMVCCEMMAKGNGCCCGKDMAAGSQSKPGGNQESDNAKEHAR
jgi:hypothetical protein